MQIADVFLRAYSFTTHYFPTVGKNMFFSDKKHE